MVTIAIDPRLAEDAVALALARRGDADPASLAWHAARELRYAIADARERERAFQALALQWLRELDLARPLHAALDACPRVRDELARIDVRRAVRARDEGSELLGGLRSPRPERMLLAIVPQRLAERRTLERFALGELLHAEDVLDPAFGFTRAIDAGDGASEPRRDLVRDRLRVLWDARVAGRIERRSASGPHDASAGMSGAAVLAAPPAPPRFHAAFAAWSDRAEVETLFRRAWSGELADFAALLAAASATRETQRRAHA